jgi:hypothetical protein
MHFEPSAYNRICKGIVITWDGFEAEVQCGHSATGKSELIQSKIKKFRTLKLTE